MENSAHEARAHREINPVAIIGIFPPPVGGQAIYNLSLLNELNRRGWPAKGIDCSSHATADDAIIPAPTRKDLIRVVRDGSFSLYHLTSSDTRIVGFEILLAVLSLVKRVPLVVTVLTGQFGHRAARFATAHRLLLGSALRRASWILVSNVKQERALRTLPFLLHARVNAVGCSVPLIQTVQHDPVLSAFLKGGNPGIMSVGAMRAIYGFPLLVDACTQLHKQGLNPRLLLAVSGEDDPKTAESFQKSVGAAMQSLEVRVERELPHAVCLGCIESADLFARPTLTDGDSVSIHEALELGTTVVASNATPRPAGVLLCESGDSHALAAALSKAYQNQTSHPLGGSRQDTSVDGVIRCYESILVTE